MKEDPRSAPPIPPIRLEVVLDAPVERVWRALCEPHEWWPGTVLEARPGGGFREHWTAAGGVPMLTSGTVLACEPPRLLRLSWRDEDWPAATEVEFACQPTSASTTALVLTHRAWDVLSDGGDLRSQHESGWAVHLDELSRHVRDR